MDIKRTGWYMKQGDDEYLKVRFHIEPVDGVGAECMWVRITDWVRGEGILHNNPAFTDEVKWGDVIRFQQDSDGIMEYVSHTKGERNV